MNKKSSFVIFVIILLIVSFCFIFRQKNIRKDLVDLNSSSISSINNAEQILTNLKKILNVNSPIKEFYGEWSELNNKKTPLIGQEFLLSATVSNDYVDKYGNYDDNLSSITEDSFKPLQLILNNFFESNGFKKDDQNTFRTVDNLEETVTQRFGFINSNLKCFIELTTQTDPFGRVFCGTIDQKQITWREELSPFINSKNDPNLTVRVENIVGNYARGYTTSSKNSESGWGWAAVKKDNKWKIIYTGQEAMSCQLVDQYKIPQEIYLSCY